jgi:signal peptidase I
MDEPKPNVTCATLLGALLPGVGYIYVGQPHLAYAEAAAALAAWLSLAVAVHMQAALVPFVWALLAVVSALHLVTIVHTRRLAQLATSTGQRSNYVLYALVVLVIDAVGAPAYVRSQVESFRIPTESMAPTLLPNDHFFVVKHETCPPRVGDVTVFRHSSGKTYAKRVVATAGDEVSVQGGAVRRNGQTLDRPRGGTRGDGDWKVGPEAFFVIGDNMDNSSDSRVFGEVAFDKCVGRVDSIWYADAWSRIGRLRAD